jgi:hypothetical protein
VELRTGNVVETLPTLAEWPYSCGRATQKPINTPLSLSNTCGVRDVDAVTLDKFFFLMKNFLGHFAFPVHSLSLIFICRRGADQI